MEEKTVAVYKYIISFECIIGNNLTKICSGYQTDSEIKSFEDLMLACKFCAQNEIRNLPDHIKFNVVLFHKF